MIAKTREKAAAEIREAEKIVEENRYSFSICQDCIKGTNAKAKLKCGHLACRVCAYKFAVARFIEGKPYNYYAYCSTCKKLWKIETVFMDCKCSWTQIGTKMLSKILYNGMAHLDNTLRRICKVWEMWEQSQRVRC